MKNIQVKHFCLIIALSLCYLDCNNSEQPLCSRNSLQLQKHHHHRITIDNHSDHIKKGMSFKEVQRVFGTHGKVFSHVGDGGFAWWADDGALIAISLDRHFRAEYIFAHTPLTWEQHMSQLLLAPWQWIDSASPKNDPPEKYATPPPFDPRYGPPPTYPASVLPANYP